jgi:hypothetical protein
VNIATNSFYTNNNGYHMNSYQQITGDITLSLPLKTQYEITVASCTITLPSMPFSLWGIETSFKKRFTTGIVTINRGGTNVFRLYQSNNIASATSITMPYKNTYIKLHHLGGAGIWNVINTDMMTYSPGDVYYGTKLLPFKTAPIDLQSSQNWMTTQPSIYYGINMFNITSSITITLRPADDPDYFEGFKEQVPNASKKLHSQLIWHFPGHFELPTLPYKDNFWRWYQQQNRMIHIRTHDTKTGLFKENYLGSFESYQDLIDEIKKIINV